MPSSDRVLLEWLISKAKRARGLPLSKIPSDEVDTLRSLEASRSVYLTDNPPMVWIAPSVLKRRKIQRPANTVVISETDLPYDAARLDEMPGSDRDPLTILVTDEEDQGLSRRDDGVLSRRPEYRPVITLVGCCAWPPPGTVIRDIRGERVMVLSQSRCPVCKAPSGKPDIKCLVCDHRAPKSVEKPAKKKRPAKFRPKGAPAV